MRYASLYISRNLPKSPEVGWHCWISLILSFGLLFHYKKNPHEHDHEVCRGFSIPPFLQRMHNLIFLCIFLGCRLQNQWNLGSFGNLNRSGFDCHQAFKANWSSRPICRIFWTWCGCFINRWSSNYCQYVPRYGNLLFFLIIFDCELLLFLWSLEHENWILELFSKFSLLIFNCWASPILGLNWALRVQNRLGLSLASNYLTKWQNLGLT